LKENLQSVLLTTLQTERAALRSWIKMQRNQAESVAVDAQVAAAIRTLFAAAKPELSANELQALETDGLTKELMPYLEAHDYHGAVIADRSGRIVYSIRKEVVGVQLSDSETRLLGDKVFAGESIVLPPTGSRARLPDRHGVVRTGVPTMFATAPVYGESGEVIAALGLRIQPDVEFTRILEIARIGKTGETYAFDRRGRMLSNSRFDEQLRAIGLLEPGTDSTLNIILRDPGIDLTRGRKPKQSPEDQPLTQMVAEAVAGRSGVSVGGYRDYRGVPVVGAWEWLDDEGFGLATEVDVSEANQTIEIIRQVFWMLFALLAAASLAMLWSMMRADRLAVQARQAALELKRLGQYTLEEKLGEGGMGVVYRARHAMLHRPTAVKFLDIARTNERTITRFEREVQLTSQLNHPNTIAIYDYGRTTEGVFYYAMEYLDGINLQDLIDHDGPLPEGRVVQVLKQVCGSLAEAHSIGLIHRDVKPANILLNRRGGMYDVVKLLDFGLVKATDGSSDSKTREGVVGTPLYMSPEACRTPEAVDARSDLYAVGAVGYFLLTGTPVFSGSSVMEILNQQVTAPVQPPHERLGRAVSSELESLLMRCLAKSAADRPATAVVVIEELERCPAGEWTQALARKWWDDFAPQRSYQPDSDTALSAEIAATVVVEPQEKTELELKPPDFKIRGTSK
jgi:tRNA A-37 threonylcarbamoyl transferase component Bud32